MKVKITAGISRLSILTTSEMAAVSPLTMSCGFEKSQFPSLCFLQYFSSFESAGNSVSELCCSHGYSSLWQVMCTLKGVNPVILINLLHRLLGLASEHELGLRIRRQVTLSAIVKLK